MAICVLGAAQAKRPASPTATFRSERLPGYYLRGRKAVALGENRTLRVHPKPTSSELVQQQTATATLHANMWTCASLVQLCLHEFAQLLLDLTVCGLFLIVVGELSN